MKTGFTLKQDGLALLAGGLAPLSLSPVDFWPAALLSVILLYCLLQGLQPAQAARLGWSYGVGFFAVGASWVYVSINVYGNASPILAGLLTLAFVLAMALLFALQCRIYQHLPGTGLRALSFTAVWVLFEWLRSWLLTGFPWLYLGYAHIGTWLAGYAPVFGVYALSFIVVLSAVLPAQVYLNWQHARLHGRPSPRLLLPLGVPLLLWSAGLLLQQVNWVEARTDESVRVGLVQGNTDQNRKFEAAYIRETLDRYEAMSAPLWQEDIVFWSETSIPLFYQDASAEIGHFSNLASRHGSTLVSGLFYRDGNRYYNSIASLGDEESIYHKQKLVPFGEYVPFAAISRSLLQLFDLPMSALSPGPRQQAGLRAASHELAPFICYEVVYPDFVRRQAAGADFLVTISNDTWFGASFGPLQHLQMARMRALENQRFMVRSTSNGVSAIIDERGRILARTEQFQAQTLRGEVRLFEGRSPFSRWGSWPVLGFSLLCLLFLFLKTRQQLTF